MPVRLTPDYFFDSFSAIYRTVASMPDFRNIVQCAEIITRTFLFLFIADGFGAP